MLGLNLSREFWGDSATPRGVLGRLCHPRGGVLGRLCQPSILVKNQTKHAKKFKPNVFLGILQKAVVVWKALCCAFLEEALEQLFLFVRFAIYLSTKHQKLQSQFLAAWCSTQHVGTKLPLAL